MRGESIETCVEMCIEMCMEMCTDMCIDMCADMCMDMCMDMYMGMCIDMYMARRSLNFAQAKLSLVWTRSISPENPFQIKAQVVTIFCSH